MEIRCDALLFDVDGTLVDSTAAIERTWRRWAAEWSHDPDAIIAVCHGRRSKDVIAQFVAAEDVARATARLDELELADLAGIVAVPGAPELLAGLPARAWAVVTSGSHALASSRLRAAGLPLPEVMVNGPDLRHGKPHPEGFLTAARLLGVDPGRCVVFEDAPAGVAAGKAAGAAVVAVTVTNPASALAQADVVVPDLSAVAVAADGDGFLVSVRCPAGSRGG
ncbi:phosphatase [Carbonactinospora thermoautotrophica]|nr:HAD-IA family hydrolase [Carbonactinospora thermoautotrophica]MCX9191269.1 phosphatase [Carbonactinospora thermoautotrophica]